MRASVIQYKEEPCDSGSADLRQGESNPHSDFQNLTGTSLSENTSVVKFS